MPTPPPGTRSRRWTRGPGNATTEELRRLALLRSVIPEGAVAGRRTAAFLHGLHLEMPTERGRPLPLQVLRPPGLEPLAHVQAGIEGFTATVGEDRVVVDDVPVTSVERTLLDVARFESPLLGLAILDHALRDGLFDPADLSARLEVFRGERWVARARRLLRWADAGAESPGESWTRLRLLEAGLPRPETQIPVVQGRGAPRRLDLGYRTRRLAVEYDGFEFHTGDGTVERDSRRRRQLADGGWNVIVVGAGDVLGRSTALEAAVAEVLGLAKAIPPRRW